MPDFNAFLVNLYLRQDSKVFAVSNTDWSIQILSALAVCKEGLDLLFIHRHCAHRCEYFERCIHIRFSEKG